MHRQSEARSGFALIATVSVMVLLVMIALAMLSLSAIELRSSGRGHHQQEARANARLALMMALGELQRLAGPDQRVTARAAILEDPSGAETLANRNWLGVWKTTFRSGDREWPLIGKAPDNRVGPYPHQGIYSDLRETESSLSEGKWREALLEGWLVSRRSPTLLPARLLGGSDPHVVELLGRGTLGRDYNAADYTDHRVLVEKVDVLSGGGHGSYAWYVSDNNQKASIALDPDAAGDPQISFLASQTDNPTSIQSVGGEAPYQEYSDAAKGKYGKMITDRSVAMIGGTEVKRKQLDRALGADFHHLTTHGEGLFVDVVLGSLKKDLSPLLFGDPGREIVSFASADSSVAAFAFSSDTPIIPGPRHAVLGPSFGALRYWGRMKSLKGLASGEIEAQVSHRDSSSTRSRPRIDWPHGIADGLTFDGAQWASKAPKIHPVMTDVRWHYYFSHTEGEAGTQGSLRSHLMPRVCLWNPYNVSLQTQELIVLMPNPFRRKNSFHMVFDETEVERLKVLYPEPEYHLDLWGKLNRDGEHIGPFKIQPKGGVRGGRRIDMFPDDRYLGFVLDATQFGPGECLVFSPRVNAPDHSSQQVGIQKYNKDDISTNRLSAKNEQGADHFFHDYEGGFKLQVEWMEPGVDENGDPVMEGKSGWRTIDDTVFAEMKLGEIKYYEPWPVLFDNFPFVLKSANGTATQSVASITSLAATQFPTLQLINNGNGGVSTYNYWYYASWWGSSQAASIEEFGYLESFQESPGKNPPALHQFGSKLLWLDESATEANMPPMRSGRWTSDHVVYHPATIAQWNVRSGLVTRSPVSACAKEWYTNSGGGWLQQFSPLSPRDVNDIPSLNEGGYFSKSPFGLASQFSAEPAAVMFDLPSAKYGALSMGALRHAQLSPYSWHPSYLVGSSLADIHAPFDTSARLSLGGPYSGNQKSSWDEAIGGTDPYPMDHGPRTRGLNSNGLLQIGSQAVTKVVDGITLSSKDEVLPYDIVFEVNQNLWDQYFLSGVPIEADGSSFDWHPDRGESLWNPRYQINVSAMGKMARFGEVVAKINGADGLEFGFWHHAYLLKNRGAFNVNSTSVKAWISFLSGLQGRVRTTKAGAVGGGSRSVFARFQKPQDAVETDQTGVAVKGGWSGGRILNEAEMATLAEEIVKEVKLRGPFVSLSDFVNRRLAAKPVDFQKSSPMMCGTIEAAITRSGLNEKYEVAPFLTTTTVTNDYNRDDAIERWKLDVDKQPTSKAWGIPGFLTQGDILEPMAPAMSVRGDSFIIRCYGESRDESGAIVAKAYLEAVVMRSADYVQAAAMVGPAAGSMLNKATATSLMVDRSTGELKEGELSSINQKFGREFVIQSFRWLSTNEV